MNCNKSSKRLGKDFFVEFLELRLNNTNALINCEK